MAYTTKVALIMGSGSDYPVVQKAQERLAAFGIPFRFSLNSLISITIPSHGLSHFTLSGG
ncbi:MAG: AIR carboxylase family protein [Treponema sp.]|nr:AIR carboxylase family protein [Treponema sp.]